MAGTKISGMTAATSIAEADLFAMVDAAGLTNKKVTLAQFRTSLESASFTAVSNTKYTSVMPSSLTVTMSDTSDFTAGLPVRWKIGASYYYGIVDSVSTNSSITIAGASDFGTISELARGRESGVVVVECKPGLSSNFFQTTGDKLFSTLNYPNKWKYGRAHLCLYNFVNNGAAASTSFKMKIAGVAVSATALTTSASSLVYAEMKSLDSTAYTILYGDAIELNVTSASASAFLPTIALVFVLE